jgi:hypothetical protein
LSNHNTIYASGIFHHLKRRVASDLFSYPP